MTVDATTALHAATRYAPSTVIVSATFTRNSVPSDPDELVVSYGLRGTEPDAVLVFGVDEQVANPTVGVFEVAITPTRAGEWVVRFIGRWHDEEGDVYRTIERHWVVHGSALTGGE